MIFHYENQVIQAINQANFTSILWSQKIGMDCSEEYIRMEMECEPKKSFRRGLKDLQNYILFDIKINCLRNEETN